MHAGGLFVGSLGRRLVQYAVAGTVGNLIVRAAGRVAPQASPTARRLAVATAAQGIVVGRRLGEWGEEARLRTQDIVAEARTSLGEQVSPPAPRTPHDHGHEH